MLVATGTCFQIHSIQKYVYQITINVIFYISAVALNMSDIEHMIRTRQIQDAALAEVNEKISAW